MYGSVTARRAAAKLPPMRFGLVAALALLPLAAGAWGWPSCLDPLLTSPVALEREAPAYPEAARLANAEGSVEVAFTVLASGGVGWIRLVNAEPSGFFEQAALEGVRGWRFTPATRDGLPVECRVKTRLRFTLADVATLVAGGPAAEGLAPPAYPAAARAARLEGHVELRVTVSPDGRVTQAEVVAAMPRGDFERAALEAVRGWRLPPADASRSLRRRFEFSLPEAVLKFRQGVGRLIRTRTDSGIIAVLDNRVLTKRYGQQFLDAIPSCPVEVV